MEARHFLIDTQNERTGLFTLRKLRKIYTEFRSDYGHYGKKKLTTDHFVLKVRKHRRRFSRYLSMFPTVRCAFLPRRARSLSAAISIVSVLAVCALLLRTFDLFINLRTRGFRSWKDTDWCDRRVGSTREGFPDHVTAVSAITERSLCHLN